MLSLLFMIIAGGFNAVMDKIAFTFSSSIFKDRNPMFWDVSQSWKNQWKWPLEAFTGWWYFGLYKPKYQEHFPYSTTMLVMFTDAWHLAKAMMLLFVGLAIVCYNPIFGGFLDLVLMYCGFTVMFTYAYTYWLTAKN